MRMAVDGLGGGRLKGRAEELGEGGPSENVVILSDTEGSAGTPLLGVVLLSDSEDSDAEGGTGPPLDAVVLLSDSEDSDAEGGTGPPLDAVVLLSDSEPEVSRSVGGTADAGVNDNEDGRSNMVSEHLLDERQGRRVLDGALSKLLEVFPHVCQDAAAADLSSQLGKTSPTTALEDVMNRYLEHGVPDAEIVPREEPTPGKMKPRDMVFE